MPTHLRALLLQQHCLRRRNAAAAGQAVVQGHLPKHAWGRGGGGGGLLEAHAGGGHAASVAHRSARRWRRLDVCACVLDNRSGYGRIRRTHWAPQAPVGHSCIGVRMSSCSAYCPSLSGNSPPPTSTPTDITQHVRLRPPPLPTHPPTQPLLHQPIMPPLLPTTPLPAPCLDRLASRPSPSAHSRRPGSRRQWQWQWPAGRQAPGPGPGLQLNLLRGLRQHESSSEHGQVRVIKGCAGYVQTRPRAGRCPTRTTRLAAAEIPKAPKAAAPPPA